MTPAEFQLSAVRHIVSRLRDRSGSRRFLLADEVGLGKTIVAREVIRGIKRGRRTVIYLCSNAEIGDQNRRKLVSTAGRAISRVTELALGQDDAEDDVRLYSFTPGTSLRGGTGLAWERQLMLYLIYRIYGEEVWRGRWRSFFKCSAHWDRWSTETTFSALSKNFGGETTTAFQNELAVQWGRTKHEGRPIVEALRDQVGQYDESDEDKSRRNALIGALRGIMQRVVIRSLDADLLILDEVQKFGDVLKEARNEEHIASELFRRKTPVLLLSATPYRPLTLGHEVNAEQEHHQEELRKMLGFLFHEDVKAPDRILFKLAKVGRALEGLQESAEAAQELVKLKYELEDDLRKVICRTERNWYVLDHKKGVQEITGGGEALPRVEELQEFMRLHHGVGSKSEGPAQITEFWKSAPSLLTFLDYGYVLLQRMRESQIRVPRALLTPADRVANLASRNHRIRRVTDIALAGASAPPLWARPSYIYHRDEFPEQAQFRKVLVFSGWRFVPKAVAIITSRVATERCGHPDEDRRQPLKLSEQASSHVFDLCLPSPALAAAVNPRATAAVPTESLPPAKALLDEATENLRTILKGQGIAVAAEGGALTWQVVARLESQLGQGEAFRTVLRALRASDDDSAVLAPHRDRLLDWLSESGSLVVSERVLRRLALVAVYSPASCIYRAFKGVYPLDNAEDQALVANLCFGGMRRYFNRDHVQQVIRQHEPRIRWRRKRAARMGYAERVFAYAADAHFQATMDEFIYLLRHAAGCDSLKEAVQQLERIFGLSRGSPRTNLPQGNGALVSLKADAEIHTTHFGAAFADDSSDATGPHGQEGPLRKSVVREAFNSPFWPFVLATTSIGQEGLDFHLYCRDILHWNLPSNPVDLEQREGRLNRRDSLAIRSSVARDWPLHRRQIAVALRGENTNPWVEIFKAIEQEDNPQRYKHGLYPHWVFECADAANTIRIQRHVPFFTTSRDQDKYERLKVSLALYRLVFGQPNQEDLLARLQARLEGKDEAERTRIMSGLTRFMLNLSPMGHGNAKRRARDEIDRMLAGSDSTAKVQRLVEDVRALRRSRPGELDGAERDLDLLLDTAGQEKLPAGLDRKAARHALIALEYLRNPYDRIFDIHMDGGFADDIEVIREAAAKIRAASRT